MAERSGRVARVPYSVLNKISSVDILYDENQKRKKSKAPNKIIGVYQAERLIARRRDNERNVYLVKWEGYSSFDNTWEPEEHISPTSLRYFKNSKPPLDVVQDHIDRLRREVMVALRRKGPEQKISMEFRHDIYRFLFGGLGTAAEQKQWTLFEEKDFLRCNLPNNWKYLFTHLGDGVKVRFPVKMRIFLARSTKNYTVNREEIPQSYVEKLTFYFIKVPYGCKQ